MMKNIILICCLCCFAIIAMGQDDKPRFPDVDKSTLDRVYYPQDVTYRNYSTGAERTATPQMKLDYSRPLKNNREIFGALVPYGSEWRMGANEATEITFYDAVGIGDGTIPAGSYTLSALVNKDHWVVNFSTERNIWGNANRDQSKTVASIKVMTVMAADAQESLSMTFQKVDEQTVNLVIQWDKTRASIPIALNPVNFGGTDVSPLDMTHYPDNSRFLNYVDADKKDAASPMIKVSYGRPSKKGRNVFGELLKTGTVWRIGANESTEIVFYNNVKIGNTEIRRGRYSMFAKLTSDTSWDIIFSKDTPTWGAANRDETKDIATVSIPVTKEAEVVEALSIIFEEESANQVNMVIAWDKTRATMPITIMK